MAVLPSGSKRILILSCLYPPYSVGGAENTVRKIAQGLVERGHIVKVIATVPPAEARQDFDDTVAVQFVSNHNSYWPFDNQIRSGLQKMVWHARDNHNLKQAKRIAKVIADFQPDVLQTHNLTGFSTSVWGPAKAAGIPIIHFLHDYGLLCSRTALFHHNQACGGPAAVNEIDPAKRCRSCIYLSVGKASKSNQVDAVVGVSQAVLDVHIKAGMFANARIQTVIHNSLSPQALARQPQMRPVRTGPLTIGFMGTVNVEKGMEVFMQALQALPTGRWRALVGGRGKGNYVEELKQRYPNSPVDFLGYIRHDAFYPDIDVLVVPSIWREPLGNVVMEAFSYGIPVIAAKRGGIPEMIDEGKTGYLFDPDYPEQLTQHLKRFIDDPTLTHQFFEPIQQKLPYFSLDRQLSQYQGVLDTLFAKQD